MQDDAFPTFHLTFLASRFLYFLNLGQAVDQSFRELHLGSPCGQGRRLSCEGFEPYKELVDAKVGPMVRFDIHSLLRATERATGLTWGMIKLR